MLVTPIEFLDKIISFFKSSDATNIELAKVLLAPHIDISIDYSYVVIEDKLFVGIGTFKYDAKINYQQHNGVRVVASQETIATVEFKLISIFGDESIFFDLFNELTVDLVITPSTLGDNHNWFVTNICIGQLNMQYEDVEILMTFESHT